MPIDLIIYIVIAAGLVLWLRNTLGTQHGEERQRPNPLEMLKNQQQTGKVIDITDQVTVLDEQALTALRGVAIEGADVGREILDLIQFDPHFDVRRFVEGARDAFPLIVESFAKGDLATLKELLAPTVYTAFEQAIEDRGVRGETISGEVHAVKAIKIMGVKRIERMIFIKIRVEADETCVIRDREGTILSGNPDRITTMNDVWTFGRDTRSKDPTWLLYETSDDVPETVKSSIPETKDGGL
ncbi:MAG: Tim44/TimA family putative adaptor protein [Pseudomonadota bacterium]